MLRISHCKDEGRSFFSVNLLKRDVVSLIALIKSDLSLNVPRN